MQKIILSSILFFFVLISKAQGPCTFVLPADVIRITTDTALTGNFNKNYLVCDGGFLHYTDNSYMERIYIESGGKVELTGYGYSKIYAKSGAEFDANNVQFDSLYYTTGTTVTDTNITMGFNKKKLCSTITFDYSLVPSSSHCAGNASQNEIKKSSFSIWPNPASTFININGEESEPTEFSIFDPLGKVVYRTALVQLPYKHDLNNLKEGIYFLKLKNRFGQRIFKFLVR